MQLTIGMACYDDYHGVVFSLQSLALHQQVKDCEAVVIDNNPNSSHGKEVARFCELSKDRKVFPIRYIPMGNITGTTQSRERVFAEARGQAVLVMDCHVLFAAGAIERLKNWWQSNPDSKDIVSGPLVVDHLQDFHTHFNPQWRGGMYGTWATAWRCTCKKPFQFTTLELLDQVAYRDLATGLSTVSSCGYCGRVLPAIGWSGHQQILVQAGFQPLGFSNEDPNFEVPGQGLGVFSCLKKSWPGFNPNFRGFGGEELYIHDKVRRHGGKALILPQLKWWHRFGRPDGAKYPNTVWGKVRNYVLGHLELGHDTTPIYDHFVSLDTKGEALQDHLLHVHGTDLAEVKGKSQTDLDLLHKSYKLTQEQWDHLIADPVHHVAPPRTNVVVAFDTGRPQPPEGSDLDAIFEWCRTVPRDLDQHLPLLKDLASKCNHVTEITKRRESTVGLLAGRPAVLVSYQKEADILLKTLSQVVTEDALTRTDSRHVQSITTHWGADSSEMDTIAETDLLYLDSVMSGERLAMELGQHGGRVRRFLVIRGTGAFGEKAEGIDAPGLYHALRPWMEANPKWFISYHAQNEYGITVLANLAEDRPKYPIHAWPPGYGPGTEFKAMVADELGITMPNSCTCNALAVQMDLWGVGGCRENFDTIVAQIKNNQNAWGWTEKFSNYASAAAGSFKSGLAFKVNWLDPIPGLVTEAIRRAEVKEKARLAA